MTPADRQRSARDDTTGGHGCSECGDSRVPPMWTVMFGANDVGSFAWKHISCTRFREWLHDHAR